MLARDRHSQRVHGVAPMNELLRVKNRWGRRGLLAVLGVMVALLLSAQTPRQANAPVPDGMAAGVQEGMGAPATSADATTENPPNPGGNTPANSAQAPTDDSPPGFVVFDDFYLAEQWALFNWAQTVGGQVVGTADVDVRAPEVWSVTTGDPSVIVAVLDTGVALDHPDLTANIWTNPREAGDGRESNGIDDDGNGYVDDWRGWDFVDSNNDPGDHRVKKIAAERAEMFHGTAVASVIAAVAGNGIGMAGVAPRTNIMALRVVTPGDGISDGHVAEAIRYAQANGARIVNMSFVSGRSGFNTRETAAAIEAAPEILFVVSAGNGGQNVDVTGSEPCALQLENLICVAATDEHDRLAQFVQRGSNWGPNTVHLSAPGANILVAQGAVATLFEDGFDDPLAGRWEVAGNDVAAAVEVDAGHDGSALALYGESVTAAGAVRMVEPVDLSGHTGCWLDFWMRSDVDYLVRLDVSRDGERFTRSGAFRASQSRSSDEFTHHFVALDHDGPMWLGFWIDRAGEFVFDDFQVTCTGTEFTDRSYGYVEGTSFAAPMVSGAAALIVAEFPHISPVEVKQAIMESSVPVEGLEGSTVSGGRLDVYGALLAAERVTSAQASTFGSDGDRPKALFTDSYQEATGELLDRELPDDYRAPPDGRDESDEPEPTEEEPAPEPTEEEEPAPEATEEPAPETGEPAPETGEPAPETGDESDDAEATWWSLRIDTGILCLAVAAGSGTAVGTLSSVGTAALRIPTIRRSVMRTVSAGVALIAAAMLLITIWASVPALLTLLGVGMLAAGLTTIIALRLIPDKGGTGA